MMKCPSCVLRVLIEFAGVPIIVSTVAATGAARRAGTGKDSGSFIGSFTPFPGCSAGSGPAPGVLPGFQLMALNGRDIKHLWVETPGDQMLQLLPSEVKV